MISGAEKQDGALWERGENKLRAECTKLKWPATRIEREINEARNEVLRHAKEVIQPFNAEQARTMRQFISRRRGERDVQCPA